MRGMRKKREIPPKYVYRLRQIDKFMQAFEQAWYQLKGEKILLSYRSGWYYWGRFKYRRSSMERFMEDLEREIHKTS